MLYIYMLQYMKSTCLYCILIHLIYKKFHFVVGQFRFLLLELRNERYVDIEKNIPQGGAKYVYPS